MSGSVTLYHYTTKENGKRIMDSGLIKQSKIVRGDAVIGDGVYLTHLAPGGIPKAAIALNNYDSAAEHKLQGGYLDAAIKINVKESDVKCAKLNDRVVYLYKGDLKLPSSASLLNVEDITENYTSYRYDYYTSDSSSDNDSASDCDGYDDDCNKEEQPQSEDRCEDEEEDEEEESYYDGEEDDFDEDEEDNDNEDQDEYDEDEDDQGKEEEDDCCNEDEECDFGDQGGEDGEYIEDGQDDHYDEDEAYNYNDEQEDGEYDYEQEDDDCNDEDDDYDEEDDDYDD